MGQCQGKQKFDEDEKIKQILAQFDVPMHYTDEYNIFQTFSWLEIIKHQTIPNFSLIYSKIEDSQSKTKDIVSNWKTKYESHNHPNLLNIHAISVINEMRLFIPFTQLIILIDKPIQPLTRHKKVIMKQPFTHNEIIFLLDCVCGALSFQQENKIYPYSFEMSDIVTTLTPFNQEVYKIVDRYFKQTRTSLFQEFILQYDDKLALIDMKKEAFLSPIQIEAIPKKDKYLKHNRYKSDVFNFGLILIYLITTKKPEVYDWKNWTIDEFQLRKAQEDLVQTGFSESLLHLIEIMLEKEEKDRPDFIELNQLVDKLFKDLKLYRLLEQHPPQEFLIVQKNQNEIQNLPQTNLMQTQTIFQTAQVDEQQLNYIASKHQRYESQNMNNESMQVVRQQVTNYQNGLTVIQGKLTYSNGFYYVGQICNRRRHGLGVYYDKNHQKVTEGMWVYDVPDGDITYYNTPKEENEKSYLNLARKDWVQYKGQVKHGQKHGIGVLYFSDGSKYMGMFVCDQAQGKGQFQSQTKELIVGTWQHDIFIN